MLIMPGETIQYYMEVASGQSFIGRVRLEYTQNGGHYWLIEDDISGSDIDQTGTAGTPLTGTVDLGWIKNETTKNKLYRWNCLSFDAASNDIVCNMSNHLTLTREFLGRTVVQISSTIYHIYDSGAPLSGTDGDGADFAGTGSYYTDSSAPAFYINIGTASQPNWSQIS